MRLFWRIFALSLGISVSGCAFTSPYSSAPRAMIDDLTLGSPTNPSYFVVAVDGKPVQRLEGDSVYSVPCAVVSPGVHSLKLEQRTGENPKTATVSATFQAGRRYRIQNEGDNVMVVETATVAEAGDGPTRR